MPATTTTQVPSGRTEFYDRLLLERAKQLLLHGKYGQKRNIPRKESKTIKFRKYGNLTVATTPLTEGVTPVGSQLSVTDITATIAQYGDYIEITDMVDGVVQDNVRTETYEILGDQAGETLDTIDRNILNAGTSYRRANGVTNRTDVITKISTTDIKVAIRSLMSANGKRFYDEIKASTGVNTKGVAKSFVCICHTDAIYDLEELSGFIPVQDYANSGAAMEGEVGAWRNVRFVATTNAMIWAGGGAAVSTSGLKATGGNVDVYSFLIFAKDAYGVVDLDGMAMEHIEKPFGSGDDPLNQRMTMAWKSAHTCKILNESWMFRIEAGVTA